ncbi:hypothetical protein NUU61_001262 [Penicillium alfredii]|uniref:Zn(2)-C6 fungal-type domain-containing protein n=1 Tax=Penicillium alfredii TaxID=1506179 RepID=A0A9W9GBQ1_9EURO|nr:uncharacterized protein NUU61_001262 [Penicillium alfredii]KAJ5115503.1 hypothetical protein NUU61_001262 [Penicillium alfredii]
MSSPSSARPYRSKRQRPCDQCRARKLGCQTDGGIPCQRCRATRLDCTFDNPPPKRPRVSEPLSSFDVPSIEVALPSQPEHSILGSASTQARSVSQNAEPRFSSLALDQTANDPSPASGMLPMGGPPTQFVQSIDQLDHGYAQLFGASAESDPWLLRHCQFDDSGMKFFYKVHFRNAGGVPTAQRIPVHFMISSDELTTAFKHETRAGVGDATRDRLNYLVPPEYGRRLVALFVKYVFPALPIISRSQLGLSAASYQLPELSTLAKVPVHLLAAVYASAFPFVGHDDYLCVLNMYHTSPIETLWRMVYELVTEEIHSPRLAVVQAALLYVHQHPTDEARFTTADTPFVWSFVGQLVGLACSLGLHIECRMWGIPAWEKRLRRRLWWAVYAEDKWRSLLMGRPPFIHPAEWDVSDLDEGDFLVGPRQGFSTSSCDTEIPFRYLVNLARIAEEIHETFYTLRASQFLNANFNTSSDLGRALLEKLNEWYSSLPETFRLPNWSKSVHGLAPYPTSIHFAYLLLVVYVYRAMLRPMARSSSPPLIFDLEDMSATSLPVDEAILDFAEVPELESLPEIEISDEYGTGEATLHAAEKCATIVVNFTRRLTSSDFTGFWYSCTAPIKLDLEIPIADFTFPGSRIGFATISNFLMLLLVQAPNIAHATRGKSLVDSWLQVLRCQSQSFPLVKLGLARLDALHWAGLSETFALPPQVEEVIANPHFPES